MPLRKASREQMYWKQIIVSLIFFLFQNVSFSGTPVTDIVFYQSYLDFKIVEKAANTGVLDEEISKYLLDEKIALDLKAAIINALSWEILGKNNAAFFKQQLAKKYSKAIFSDVNVYSLSPSDLMCLAYLIVMDDYFSAEKALFYITEAKKKTRDNYTINLVFLIIKAQVEYKNNKCTIWQDYQRFLKSKNSWDPILPEEQSKIETYFIQFEKFCEEKD
jgi:hypothetical protein